MNRKTLLYTVGLIAQNYGLILIGVLASIFSARSLSVSDRGELALFILITQLCSRLGSIGFEQIIHRGESSVNLVNFYVASAIGCLMTIPIAYWGISSTNLPQLFVPLSVSVAIAISALRVNIATLLYAENLKILTLLNFSQAVSQIISYGLVFRFHNLALFIAMWCITVVSFAALSLFLVREKEYNVGKNNFGIVLSIWKQGFNFSSTVVPEIATSFCVELPIVREVLGRQAAGVYAVSNTITGIAYQIFVAIGAVLGKKRVRNRYPIFLIVGLICLGIVLVSGDVISFVFGKRYEEAAIYVKIIMPATFLLGILRIEQMNSTQLVKKTSQLSPILGLFGLFLLAYFLPGKILVWYIAVSYAIYSILSLLIIKKGAESGV